MSDQQSLGRITGIEASLLAVLYHEVLVGMVVVVDDIGVAMFTHGLQVGHRQAGVTEHDGFLPSAHHLLVGCITSGKEGRTIVAARAHQVEIAHAEPAAVVGVVEIGESHAVAELMAEASDALDGTIGIDLVAAGVCVDHHAVERNGTAGSFLQCVHVGPDGVGSTAVGLALAGIEHEHLVHLAVAVPVVVGEVHFGICLLTGFFDHRFGTHVVALGVVGAIVFLVVAHGVGAHHVEVEFELSGALLLEVVGHRPPERALVVAGFVHDALVLGQIVG